MHFCAGETGVVVGGASHRPDSGGDISGDGITKVQFSVGWACVPHFSLKTHHFLP